MAGDRKVCIITGANSGIGFEAATRMARLGYHVVLACRSAERGNEAVARIQRKHLEANVSFLPLDLASLESIRRFVQAFRSTGLKLNVLINNAGLGVWSSTVPQFTNDGFELTFGVNHLGHFLLTNLLLGELKATAKTDGEARIVVVSSLVHDPDLRGGSGKRRAHIDFDDMQSLQPRAFSGEIAYKNSKLANILFTYELNKRLEGTNISCNAMNPGLIPTTGFFRNLGACTRCCMRCCCLSFGRCLHITRSVAQGAECIVLLATSDDLRGVGGKYFSDCEETPSSQESYDTSVSARLWDESAKLVGLQEVS